MCIDICQSPEINWNMWEAIGTAAAALVAAVAIYHAHHLQKLRVKKAEDNVKDAAAVLGVGLNEELTVLRGLLKPVADFSQHPHQGAASSLYSVTIGFSLMQPTLLKRSAMRLHLFGPTPGALLMAILSSVGRLEPNKDILDHIQTLDDEQALPRLIVLAHIAGALITKIDEAILLLGPFTTRAVHIAPH